MAMANGALCVNYKTRGINTTHSTGFHDNWNAGRANFVLPDTVPVLGRSAYWQTFLNYPRLLASLLIPSLHQALIPSPSVVLNWNPRLLT